MTENTSKDEKVASKKSDSVFGILRFAFIVCLIPAVLVSSVAVSLKSKQDENKLIDKQKNILLAAGMIEEGQKLTVEEIAQLFEKVRVTAVDLDKGDIALEVSAETYDQRKSSKDPLASTTLSGDEDIALIKRREHVGLVYEILDNNQEVQRYIFPVRGYGLWSTLRGFLALSKDGKVVEGLTFYEHAETPGLGGEVDNPSWKAQWKGKTAFGNDGKVSVKVVKGKASKDSSTDIDGLSGATITAKGVDNMVKFWLGKKGYGNYIMKNLREKKG